MLSQVALTHLRIAPLVSQISRVDKNIAFGEFDGAVVRI